MNKSAPVRKWVGHKLDAAIELRLQRLAGAEDVAEVCVMPDVHLAGDVCNGVVVATKQLIYPQCIGGDIGCGYLCVELLPEKEIDESTAAKILAGLYRAVPINKHVNRDTIEIGLELSAATLTKAASRDGRLQLGTLGRGNHFIELQRRSGDELYMLIHSGSRAMGQLISTHHLKQAEVDTSSKLKFLDAENEFGQALLNDIEWARRYASESRTAMLESIAQDILAPIGIAVNQDSMIHVDHNHVQREIHGGETFWVHRKGAQGLAHGQTSIIPGSMGAATYVVAGRANRNSLNSCSHGAGRSMSRGQAAQRISTKKLRQEMKNVWFDERKMASLSDEAPSAYKNVRKVMKAQKDLVRIIDRRHPVLNFKGR